MVRRRLSRRGPVAAPPAREFVVQHRLLLAALVIVLLFHGGLLLSGSYQRTYDAFVHLFMADHYRRDWFSSWDQRWYTGFTVLSYPPGSHQTMALVSDLVGLRAAFVTVQLGALLNLTIGVYRWAHLWVDHQSAGWAAILLAVSSAIAETVHVFGQLPTTFSLGFLLNSLPFAHRWVRTGARRALLLGIACTMATTAGHHVTTLFGAVFFVGPVLVSALLERLRTPLPGEAQGHPPRLARGLVWPLVARRLRRVVRPLGRTVVYAGLVGAALLAVVLPYWLWSASDPITQVSIPHASRDSFLANRSAGLVFWLVPWGTTLLALPYALVRGLASRAWPLGASLALLAFLGTGGTTPLPRMLLGGAYDILTLDRFTFWATMSILPLAGRFVVSVAGGTVRRWLLANVGPVLATGLPLLYAASHLTFTLFCTNLTHYRPFQPQIIDAKPIVSFLEKDEHWRWRYLMLGFGDQMAWVSANTTAATVDGNYHSARRLPELTSRPIERLEGAKFAGIPGIGSLQQFLAVPSRYSLKYVFCNDEFYNPLLHFSGWHEIGRLDNGIMVWERADVPPLPAMDLSRQAPAWQRYCWGTVPPAALVNAGVLLLWAAAGAPLPRPGRGRPHPRGTRLGRAGRAVARVWAGIRRWQPGALLLRALDRWLERASARIPLGERPDAARWLPWAPVLHRLRSRAARAVPGRRRRAQTAGVVAVMVGAAGVGVTLLAPRAPGPRQVVTAYYEHLDFRRFSEAYALLDPRTRPDFTQYRMDLSRDGGLVASFAKLNTITTRVTQRGPARAEVTAELEFLTSLDVYRMTERVTVRQVAGTWAVDLPPADPTEPPDQFTNRVDATFLSQGRRVATSGATGTADILDRPELALSRVRSLRVGQRWIVVGEVTNVDTDPADVTVNAQLRDRRGVLLGSWDAAQVLLHKLMPGETSPFRVEFQNIAGTAATGAETGGGPTQDSGAAPSGSGGGPATPAPSGTTAGADPRGPVEFDPRTITPLTLPDGAQVASVDVYARAVVTAQRTTRGLHVRDLRVERAGDGVDHLVGVLRNDTTSEASVPHLLIAYTTAGGELAWVDHAYLAHSVGPQRATPFRIPLLGSTPEILPSGVPTTTYTGPTTHPTPTPLAALAPVPGHPLYAAVTVYCGAYQRGAVP